MGYTNCEYNSLLGWKLFGDVFSMADIATFDGINANDEFDLKHVYT